MQAPADFMDELAAELAPLVSRPVTTDPRNLANLPAVLIEPPTIRNDVATACGEMHYTAVILVVGLPGARTEFGPLSDLLMEVLAAVEWTEAVPVGYVPLASSGNAEPNQAYRVTFDSLV